MRIRSLLVAIALAFGFLPPHQRAAAQNPPALAPHSLPSDAEMDALLAARKWNELGAALAIPDNAATLFKGMNWLYSRIDRGGNFFLGLLFARDLWAVGKARNIADPNVDMRVTAGVVTLYAFEIVIIDGAECEDTSAPGHRLEQILTTRRETLAFIKQQPQAVKTYVVNSAIELEQKTAKLRRQDDLVCRGGMAEYAAGIEKGTQTQVPNIDGHYGKTIDVRPPAGWEPKFVAASVYEPLQAKARAGMRAALQRLIE